MSIFLTSFEMANGMTDIAIDSILDKHEIQGWIE